MKKLIVTATFFFSSFWLLAQQSSFTALDVQQAASNQQLNLLSKIPSGKEVIYGFDSKEQIQRAAASQPVRLLTLNNNFYLPGSNVGEEQLQMQDEWRVPLQVNGENKTLLTVVNVNHELRVADMGGAILAKEIGQQSKAFDKKGNLFLFRVYELGIDFLVSSDKGRWSEATIVPLQSALQAMPLLQAEKNISFSTLLPLLKSQYQQLHKN